MDDEKKKFVFPQKTFDDLVDALSVDELRAAVKEQQKTIQSMAATIIECSGGEHPR